MSLPTAEDLRESHDLDALVRAQEEHTARAQALRAVPDDLLPKSERLTLAFHTRQVILLTDLVQAEERRRRLSGESEQRSAEQRAQLENEAATRLASQPLRGTTMPEVIAELQARRQSRIDRRSAIRSAIEARGLNATSTPDEHRELTEIRDDLKVLDQRITDLRESSGRDDAAEAERRRNPSAYDQVGRIGQERRTYDRYSAEVDKRSFFMEAYHAQVMGDPGAQYRMQRHAHEMEIDRREVRAGTTSGYAGLVVPQYLVEQAALVARAGRPVANSVTRMPLPEQGMTFQLPVSSTGAAVASQSTENSGVQNTDEAWGNVTLSVVTIAGQQDVSRQSLDRGFPNLDMLIMQDLTNAYYAELDRQLINGSGASNQLLGILQTSGINTATAFGAAVTAANFSTKVAGANNSIMTTRFMAASVIWMHPRRWQFLLSLSDSSGRPLVTPNVQGPNNAVGVLKDAMEYGQIVGSFQGLPVITDANIPTTVGTNSEDVAIVARAEDILLFEDNDGTPQQLRFEQTLGNQLTTKMVLYGYAAATAARYPKAVARVGGADTTAGQGLVTPTF